MADRINRVARYLLHSGPTKGRVIAEQCKIPEGGSLSKVLDHEFFEKGEGYAPTYTLTVKGRNAAKNLALDE